MTAQLIRKSIRASAGVERAAHLKGVLLAWLAAGTLDILAAFANGSLRGVAPARVLQSIASGLVGVKAFGGGAEMAALGLALHFSIMLAIASVYLLAAERRQFLQDHAVVSGIAYGVAVYGVMNLVVLPLSQISFRPDYSLASLATGICVHILCVGLPIATIVRKHINVPPPC